jgi:uncharacterized protein (DUF2252 family)
VPRDPVAQIIAFNQRFRNRYPILLRQKIDRLASGPFGFFRGTFHLFAQDMVEGVLDPWKLENPFTPVEIPIVGDIHTENYGTYKAEDGTIHYDINDFDETTQGSFGVDCKRAVTSLFLAAYEAKRPLMEATQISESFVRTYVETLTNLSQGKPASAYACTDQVPPKAKAVRDLLGEAAASKRPEFIDRLTLLDKGRRSLKRGPKIFDLKAEDLAQARRLFADYLSRLKGAHEAKGNFYDVRDVAGRVAGCGSLGRLRYVILLEGEGSEAAKNVLLEIKESLPSAYDMARGRGLDAGACRKRAEEVTRAVRLMQTASNRNLGFAIDGDSSFQVREIGPKDRRLEWGELGRLLELDRLGGLYAELLAKAHSRADEACRAHGKGERRIVASLTGREDIFVKRVLAFALAYSEQVEEDHRLWVSRKKEAERALLP